MTDEETAKKKKTRRAARRAQQDAEGSAPVNAAAEAQGERPKGRRTARTAGDTSSIRDERLRAREVAVSRRRKKRDRERAQAAAEGLDTSELVDDALARGAHATSRFVQRHFKWLQWLIVAGVAGGFAVLIYNYREELGNQKSSALLMAGLRAEQGTIKTDTDLDAPPSGFVDMRPQFDDNKARLKAAAEGYQKAIDRDPKPSRQILAKMGLAGVLFDQGKYKEAEQAYRDVRDSKTAASDEQLKGHATEGIGLSLEAQGKKEAAEKTFKELENLGDGFKSLGQYHHARLLYASNQRDKAKEILKKLLEKADKDKEKSPFGGTGFVALAARQLLEAIDPTAAPAAPGAGISPEQLKKIQEQLKKAAGLKDGEGGTDMEELMKAINKSVGDAPEGKPAPVPVPAPNPKDAPPVPKPAPAAPKPGGTPAPAAPKPAPAAPKPGGAPAPAPAPAPAAPKPAAPPAPASVPAAPGPGTP